jgi:hypothetical protein
MRRRRAIRDALAENGVAAVITLSSPGYSTANSKKRGDDLNSQMITRTGSAPHPKKAAMVRYVFDCADVRPIGFDYCNLLPGNSQDQPAFSLFPAR